MNINSWRKQQNKMENTRGLIIKCEWTAEATSYLLDLWEENIDDLRGISKNTHIYMDMTEKMEMPGLTGVEIKNKIDNLTKKYIKEQAKVGPSGGTPSTWEHYEQIHKILTTSKAINYKKVMVESIDLTPLASSRRIDLDNSVDSFDESSTSQGKIRRVDKFERLLEIEERKLEVVREVAEEIKVFRKKLLDIFAQPYK